MATTTTKAKTQETQNKVEDAYHSAEEAATEAVHSLKNKAQESLAEGSEKIKTTTAQVENVIKERPLLSVGCAFLAGWAISKLIK
ncbi:hypothetical protein [Psychromonas sp. 14N.309.X.WAT.B.A12]|uniref:hypothetical protein n=1 Tax=unclassified Psychromonas TaxID=2614957 RepID=UPI0025B04CEE|nr:hypothetical protein [Psychromonas sp. 14N.309.X.WAT.B.A12]MDN2664891.1 hypothetical protein [Psychromonas sp. 14N.309.X.WAT.B.A12]